LESQLWRGAGESIGQNVSGSNLDRLLEKVVFEDDETGIEGRGIAKNKFPVLQNLARCDSSRVDVEVWKGSVSLRTSRLNP